MLDQDSKETLEGTQDSAVQHNRTFADVVFGYVFGFGLWSLVAPLESAAIAGGVIEPESSRKTLQHLEGGPWTFLTVVRYNSWQDFATNDMNNVTQSNKNEGGWFEFRKYSAYHTDTLANRIAP